MNSPLQLNFRIPCRAAILLLLMGGACAPAQAPATGGPAAAPAASQQGLIWPETWTVYTDVTEGDVNLDRLRQVPLAIKNETGRQEQFVNGSLNLLRPGEKPTQGRVGFVFGIVHSDRDQIVSIGCSADWWMLCRLNGVTVCNTGRTGELRRAAERSVDLPLKQGDNFLAFKVNSGEYGWQLDLAPPGKLPPPDAGSTEQGQENQVILSTDFSNAEPKSYQKAELLGDTPGISQMVVDYSDAGPVHGKAQVIETDGRKALEFTGDDSALTCPAVAAYKIIPEKIAGREDLVLKGSTVVSLLPCPKDFVRGNLGILLASSSLKYMDDPTSYISDVLLTSAFMDKLKMTAGKKYRIDVTADFSDPMQHTWEYSINEEGAREPLFSSGILKTRERQRAPVVFAVIAAGTPLIRVHSVNLETEKRIVQQQDFVWPETWIAYTDLKETDVDLASLRQVPSSIKGVPAREVHSANGYIPLLRPGEAITEHRPGFIFGNLRSTRDQVVRAGCASDWWMQGRLNGAVICDTLQTGEVRSPTTRIVNLPLKKGDNLLAFKVLSGKKGWGLALLPPGKLPASTAGSTRQESQNPVILSTDFSTSDIKAYWDGEVIGGEEENSQLTVRTPIAYAPHDQVRLVKVDDSKALEFPSDGTTAAVHATHTVDKIIPDAISARENLLLNGSVVISVLPCPGGMARGNLGIFLGSTTLSYWVNGPATIGQLNLSQGLINQLKMTPGKKYRIDFTADFSDKLQHTWDYSIYEEGVKEPLVTSGILKTRDQQRAPAVFALTASRNPFIRVYSASLSASSAGPQASDSKDKDSVGDQATGLKGAPAASPKP